MDFKFSSQEPGSLEEVSKIIIPESSTTYSKEVKNPNLGSVSEQSNVKFRKDFEHHEHARMDDFSLLDDSSVSNSKLENFQKQLIKAPYSSELFITHKPPV